MNTKLTVALIIDPPLLLEALAIVFRQQFPQITLLTGGRGSDALALATAPGQTIDLVILNDVLPDIPAATLVKRLRWYSPKLQALTLALSLPKGGRGTEPLPGSGESMEALLDSVRRLLPGLTLAATETLKASMSVPVSAAASSALSAIAPCVPSSLQQATSPFASQDATATLPRVTAPYSLTSHTSHAGDASNTVSLIRHQRLTPRQQEVLSLLAQGWRNRMIADHLHTSEKTVKAHVSAVFQVLDVSNRTQATLAAQRHGLLSA